MRRSPWFARRAALLAGVAATLLAALPFSATAQRVALGGGDDPPGRVTGRVVDAGSGRPLSGVQIQVQGTQRGAVSGVDGRFQIQAVPAGTHALAASYVGYARKTVTGIQVPAGGATTIDVTLAPAAVALQGLTVSAQAERGSVRRALDEQRTSTAVVNSVTAEQISRSPDGDAAAAVQRVSGVTVQDGKFVFVRGLGERYTTTSLNGARIPSPEPERKVVPLDLFPAGLLQTITTTKTFTPDQPGDFSGAQVNIRTREYPARRRTSFSLSTGFNSAATGKDLFLAPGTGREWLALASADRGLPWPVAQAGDLQQTPSPQQVNQMVGSFRNAWTARPETGRPNLSLGASVGGNDPLFGHRVGYLLSGSYSNAHEVRADEVRAYINATDGGREQDRFSGTTGRESVLWGGLFNLSTSLGSSSRLYLNNSYNRSADNEARREFGYDENLAMPLHIDRLRYVERSVRSSQLGAEHDLGDAHRVEWSLTSSAVSRAEPDRSEIVYGVQTDPASGQPMAPTLLASNEAAVRTFGDLDESSLEAAASYRLTFGGAAREHALKVGGLLRRTERDTDNRSYSIFFTAPDAASAALPAEEIFDGRFSTGADARFRVTPLNSGGWYTAADRLAAGYAMLELMPFERLRLIGGARVERSSVALTAEPTTGTPVDVEPSYTDWLPSLALSYELTENQNLRLSASQTLSRPEYRELAPIAYRDVIGGEKVIGNAALRRTLIRNLDARWEWYPDADELLSVALFAKRFDDPIERIYLATSGTRVVTFVNADAATNYGVELEARKGLGSFSERLSPLSVFANATLMESEIDVDEGDARQSGGNRRMVGQAPYVVNTGVTYTSGSDALSATLLYNRVGARLVSASEPGLPPVEEQPRDMLDLATRFRLSGGLSAKLDVKNLLDASYEVTQGPVTREFYRTGRSVTLGVSWSW